MSGYTHWNPYREIQELHHRLNTLLDTSLGRRTGESENLRSCEWEPAVDIFEDQKDYVIQADLPGLKKQDVNVTFENGILRLSGERKHQKAEKDRLYHRVERPQGAFSRSFTLPGSVTQSQIHADFKEGVLQVRVAKSESTKPKQIAVT